MEECGSTGHSHPWKAATMKRKAWALSRGSWQASESQDGHTAGQPSQEPTAHKEPPAEEPGRIPNKIASWLKECRTPLGASLDEQSNTPTKGTVKNACSFEDDLSLGAEANHLRASSPPSEIPHLAMLAQEKRTQFKQKGRSMNSTGSGKSNATVSSVSELLDLYEEDPEEILYNLGFGREEPDIASKIPSRFFNSASHARGIDIKVYLGAQLQRLELENPNYALTSRFRQIEVLTTVANAFSSLYSQVSGTPVQRIGNNETEPKEVPAPIRSTSALNAAKILKKTVTRRNLLAAVDGPLSARSEAEAGKGPGGSNQEQTAKVKDQPSLATVSEDEESHQGEPSVIQPSVLLNGDKGVVTKEPDSTRAGDSSLTADSDSDRSKEQAVTSTPAKESAPNRLHTCISHLLSQAKDSFEMEEVQSNEGEGPGGIRSSSKYGNEVLMRMASQQSDSSGFAEDPSTDGSSSHLKVQESSDSCDSETTVTSNVGELTTPLALDHPGFQNLLEEEDGLTPVGSESSLALDHPNFPKLQGEEGGLMATGSHGAVALDHRAFQKPLEEDEGLTDIGADGVLALDQSACCKLEGEEEDQMATSPDSKGEVNTVSQSRNLSKPKGEVEEEVVEEKEVVQENVIEGDANEKVLEENVVEEHLEDMVAEEVIIPRYIPHHIPQRAERGMHMHTPEEASSIEGPSSPTEPDAPGRIGSAAEPGSEDTQDWAHVAPQCPPQAAPACDEHSTLVWSRVRDLQQGRGRHPLRRASSLPSSLLNPSRVVSSVKIQFHPGSPQHCTPPSFSYCYTPEDDGEGSIAEKEEEKEEEEEAEEEQVPCRSTLIINSAPKERDIQAELQAEDTAPRRIPPYPLHLPAHLTNSSCSLHSMPPDWPGRPLWEMPRSWSTCSMPALSAHSAPYTSTLGHPQSASYNSPGGHPHSAPYSLPGGYPHSAPYNLPVGHPHNAPYNLPVGHPHNAPYSLPVGHPHNAPYNLPVGHQHRTSYSLPVGHSPSASYSLPLGHPHSVSYSSFFSQPHGSPYSMPLSHPHTALYHHGIPQSSRCNSPLNPPYSSAHGSSCSSNCCPACSPLSHLRLSQPPSSTEMQLKRVLHDVRSAVQNLSQGSTVLGEDMVTPRLSHHRAVQPLYEDTIHELQVIKRNLNVFRAQMMDLELALLRQQDMVYQHLTEEDRQEAEHLQSLRTAVRQELQELELQLEDRLVFLDEQLRTSTYRHPVGISRGHSLDSQCSTPPMNVTEPVTELLREQLSLQAELGLEGKPRSTMPLASNYSSRSVSPARPSRTPGHPVPNCPSLQRPDVYRTSVSLTPTLPPRHQAPEPSERTDSPPEDEGGAEATIHGGAVENPQLQELIQEIKRSITDEIRQEIVSDILAAVLPRRSPVATQEQTL